MQLSHIISLLVQAIDLNNREKELMMVEQRLIEWESRLYTQEKSMANTAATSPGVQTPPNSFKSGKGTHKTSPVRVHGFPSLIYVCFSYALLRGKYRSKQF